MVGAVASIGIGSESVLPTWFTFCTLNSGSVHKVTDSVSPFTRLRRSCPTASAPAQMSGTGNVFVEAGKALVLALDQYERGNNPARLLDGPEGTR